MNIREYIPYATQWIDELDIFETIEALRGEYLTTGPKVRTFEEKLAELTGSKYAVVISSGTAALHASCVASGIGKDDEVITTPITFPSTVNSILFVGATPVFADIDPKTYNINPYEIRKKITKKTKAILPVHFTGQPCDMDEIKKISEEFSLTVIEDATHALGAQYKGRKIGSMGNLTTFSFHPVKHITTGEGGAITTDNEALYNHMLMFRTHGITRNRSKILNDEGPWYYEQQTLGYNYRMTDVQAAIGISQLSKLNMFLNRRHEYVKMYNEAFRDSDIVTIPHQLENTKSSWYIYAIKLDFTKLKVGRKEIFNELLKREIGVNVHFLPVYYHPYYQDLGYKKGICPVAEDFYESELTLPLYPKMQADDVNYVIRCVKDIINMFRK